VLDLLKVRYAWGQLNEKTLSIQIGKQDSQKKEFLIDTLLHEYYEAQIMMNQFSDDFFKKLSKSSSRVQHEWIYEQIDKYFKGLESKP